jgi:hypothetical protein
MPSHQNARGPKLSEHPHLPILALLFITALSSVFMGLNHATHQEAEHPIVYALFCIEVAAIYVLYMVISRIAVLAIDCIEHRSIGFSSTSASPYERVIEQHIEVWGDEHDLETDTTPSAQSPISVLFARGIHREALISSMYLGGSGCFLALPALSFWNVSQTCAFLLALVAIAFFSEHTKLVEFAPNQDKAKVLRDLRYLRWLTYGTTTGFILGIMLKDTRDVVVLLLHPMMNHTAHTALQQPYDSGSIIMLILAFVSPLLLRLSLPHAIVRRTSLMSPSQALEAALPVSCLHAILVLGWYGGTTPPMGIDLSTKFLPLFVPMAILCPFCQVVMLAFILRGFRQCQTLPTIVILACTAYINQQIFSTRMRTEIDYVLLSLGLCCLCSSALLVFAKHKATAAVHLQQQKQDDEEGGGDSAVLLNDLALPDDEKDPSDTIKQ